MSKRIGQDAARIDLGRLLEEAARFAPWSLEQQKGKHIDDDVVEHHRRDHLIDAEAGLEDSGEPRIQAAANHGGHDDDRQLQQGRCSGERALAPVSEHGAGEDLTLRADIPQPGAKCDGRRQAGEDQGRRLDQCFGRGTPGPECPLQQRLEGAHRIDAHGQEQDRAEDQGGGERRRQRQDATAGGGPARAARDETQKSRSGSCRRPGPVARHQRPDHRQGGGLDAGRFP